MEINSELMLYKNFFSKILENAEKKEHTIKKYNKLITHLKEENQNLKEQYRVIIKSANRDYSNNNIEDINKHIHTSQRTNCSYINKDNKLEFVDLLHHCGITKSEFETFENNKTYTKLTEAIEICYNIISDKNTQINLLEIENDKLNIKNFELNKENILLGDVNKKLNSTSICNRNIDDDSYSNNTFTSVNNRSVNLSSLTVYQKMLEQKQMNNNTASKMMKRVIWKKKTMNSSIDSISSLDFKKDCHLNISGNHLNENDKAMILDNLNGFEERTDVNVNINGNECSFISQDSVELKKELGL